MTNLLRKIFNRKKPTQSQPAQEDTGFTSFYTNTEHALQAFDEMLGAAEPSRRVLVIHGLGGVGKSTLLKMYALNARKRGIPAALVASEEVSSPVEVLAGWSDDLNHYGIALPNFQKTFNHYRSIQARVESEAKKSDEASSQLASVLGKTAAKTVITMVASAIPVVGPLVSALGGESAEAFINWLHGFLSKPDLELYLDPVKRLTADFLSDLAQAASTRRLVLMIDTFEQMTALSDWMRELVRQLPRNVFMVIASRTVPEWNRAWQDWMGKAQIIELMEMTPDNLRTLVRRYYAFIRSGEPDPKQVEDIVEFARGLPIVATAVVQLWVKYGVENFQAVRPQVVADLVDRLLEGVPKDMRPAFEAAAVLRYFNVDALGALLEDSNVEELYAELRRWPFVRSRREGLAIHDIVREMINEALRARTPERFRKLHEKAAAYFETRLLKASADERERYLLEQLYHQVCADEDSGMQRFQEIAEEFTRYRLVNRLRALLNDVNTYPLEHESSRLWRAYYNARLAHVEARFNEAEEAYQAIGENTNAPPKLRAYVLSDWGNILRRRERLRQPGIEEKAIQVLESSLSTGTEVDMKLALSWVYLCDIYSSRANWERALFYIDRAKQFLSERKDYSGLLAVFENERGVYWRQGNFRKIFEVDKEMWSVYAALGEPAYLRAGIPPTWEWAMAGRYAEFEGEYRSALEYVTASNDLEMICRRTRDLALYLGLQGKCPEALTTAEQGVALCRNMDTSGELEVSIALTMYGIVCLKCGNLDKAEDYLAQSIAIRQKFNSNLDVAALFLAALYETQRDYDRAEHYYELLLAEARRSGHNLNVCAALTGLVRVRYSQKNYDEIVKLWDEARQLADQFEYNDYLASLYLTRGHIAWEGLIAEWESGFDTALHSYQLALIHALRFNRFLLDEVLAGRTQGSPLRPVIEQCRQQGEEGQRMLAALRDWWQQAGNDTGSPRSDTISPLPEGISLVEAERLARAREPGDGLPQKSVVEQISLYL